MPRIIVIGVAILLGACASRDQAKSGGEGWFEGENLIIPDQQLYSEWDPYEAAERGHVSMMWQHPQYGFENSFVVDIWYNKRVDPQEYRRRFDLRVEESCVSFDSEVIDVDSAYESIMWSTRCERSSGISARIVNRLIQGRDSYYHIMKIFMGVDIREAEVEIWRNSISKAYICDTRREDTSCPAGYERLDNM